MRTGSWKRLAHLELEARSEGLVVPCDPGLLGMKPMASIDDDSLRETLKIGKVPEGLELERIPQRVTGYLVAAGVDTDVARRLGHLGDPANLMIVPRGLHAAFDAYAKFDRNPTLPAPLDEGSRSARRRTRTAAPGRVLTASAWLRTSLPTTVPALSTVRPLAAT